ncbi:MAG: type II secretion system F family protein [Candidatus Omnitrophica bacterium]|nr:type II secretion system F family protein [Candidatus Omnitrophota bacterium]
MTMMLKLLIFIFSFSAVTLLLTQVLPIITERITHLHKKKFDKTINRLDNMFVRVERKKLFFFFSLSPLILGIIFFLIFNNPVGTFAGFAFGLALPTLIVRQLELERRKKFHSQLINCLMILSSSLKSGLSLLQAIEMVVEEMPAPLSQEFTILLNENKMGLSLEESLLRLNRRMYSEDLNMLITSILVGRETGGDLGKIFERLVDTMRQKNKILQQLKTLTLQTRWQGMVMMALPILFALGISRLNPQYFQTMLNSDVGRALLLYALISQVLGIIMIRRLSKLEV